MARRAELQAAELARQLQWWLDEAGVTSREASRRIGRYHDYVSRALRGEWPLRLSLAFQILAALGHRPEDFFRRYYPAEHKPAEAAGGPKAGEAKVEERLEALLAAVGRGPAPLAPGDWVGRAARLLRALISRRGLEQMAVSRALGLSPATLGQALRKGSHVSAWQLFGTLEVLRIGPGEFFAELLEPRPGEVAPGISREDAVAALERVAASAGPAAGAEEGAAETGEQPTQDEAAGQESEENGTES